MQDNAQDGEEQDIRARPAETERAETERVESQAPPDERWREWNLDECREWVRGEMEACFERYVQGRAEYGPLFVGYPLKQGANEVRDLLFYMWQSERERAALIGENAELREKNGTLAGENGTLRDELARAKARTGTDGGQR